MMKIAKYLAAAVLLTGFGTANAGVAVYNATITTFYASGNSNGNEAHAIKLSKDLSGHGCNGGGGKGLLAIPLESKALFTAALTKHMAGSTVNVLFQTGTTGVKSQGHADATCKLYSIW